MRDWLWMGKIFVLILVLDQWTKFLATVHLSLGEPVPIIPGFFNLTLVYNPGAAFGMFSSWPDGSRRLALLGVSFVALALVFWFLATEVRGDRRVRYALAGILAGAAGNIADRLRYDSVVDFLDFYWNGYHWPAFNVSDSAICLGAAYLLWEAWGSKKARE